MRWETIFWFFRIYANSRRLVCLVTEEEEKKREIEKCVGSCLFASFCFFFRRNDDYYPICDLSLLNVRPDVPFSFNAFKENEGEKKKKGKQINMNKSTVFFFLFLTKRSLRFRTGLHPKWTWHSYSKFVFTFYTGALNKVQKNKAGDDSLTSFLYEMNPKLYFILFYFNLAHYKCPKMSEGEFSVWQSMTNNINIIWAGESYNYLLDQRRMRRRNNALGGVAGVVYRQYRQTHVVLITKCVLCVVCVINIVSLVTRVTTSAEDHLHRYFCLLFLTTNNPLLAAILFLPFFFFCFF